jgi:glycine cleavage system H protein
VQLPAVGLAVVANASCAEVESTKSVSDIYAPASGTVVEVNESLTDSPETVNQDPYGAGWIFTLELSDPSQVDALLDAAAYKALVESA